MTLPRPGVNIFADNVYVSPSSPPAELVNLDEDVDDVQPILLDDQRIEQWRRELLADLANAEFFRTELRKALRLSDQAAAQHNDSELVGRVAVHLQKGALDWEAVNRIAAIVENFPEDWTAEDLARAVRAALHPAEATDEADEPQQPALAQLFPVTRPDSAQGDLFRSSS